MMFNKNQTNHNIVSMYIIAIMRTSTEDIILFASNPLILVELGRTGRGRCASHMNRSYGPSDGTRIGWPLPALVLFNRANTKLH